jgi:hypothetical protein
LSAANAGAETIARTINPMVQNNLFMSLLQ